MSLTRNECSLAVESPRRSNVKLDGLFLIQTGNEKTILTVLDYFYKNESFHCVCVGGGTHFLK